ADHALAQHQPWAEPAAPHWEPERPAYRPLHANPRPGQAPRAPLAPAPHGHGVEPPLSARRGAPQPPLRAQPEWEPDPWADPYDGGAPAARHPAEPAPSWQ